MPKQTPVIRYIVLVLALVFATGTVSADSRAQAKAHYQAGVKYYNGADYKSAIREFSAAQQLAPADLNNYNLALCYDKLGDPEPAIQYYRAYLAKQPSTDKKAEIEASIARLDAASKSVAAKKAEEARKVEEARKAEAARVAAEEAKRAEAARLAEEAAAAKQAEEARTAEADAPKVEPDEAGGPAVEGGVSAAVGVGSTGTPSTGAAISTGDAQLDRVSAIDINQIRDQRIGGAGSGMADTRGGPATTAGDPAGAGGAATNANLNTGVDPGPATAANPNPAAAAPTGQQVTGAQPPAEQPKQTPVYKKWWFWAVVAVSAYVVYSIAAEDDSSDFQTRMLPMGQASTAQPGGLTLMRW